MISNNNHFILDMTWNQAIGIPNGRDLHKMSGDYSNMMLEKDNDHL